MAKRILQQPIILEILWSRKKDAFAFHVETGTSDEGIYIQPVTSWLPLTPLDCWKLEGKQPVDVHEQACSVRLYQKLMYLHIEVSVASGGGRMTISQGRFPYEKFVKMCRDVRGKVPWEGWADEAERTGRLWSDGSQV